MVVARTDRWQHESARGLRRRLRRRAGVVIADSAYVGLAHAGLVVPHANPARHGVERIRNVPYQSGPSPMTLDVYRPRNASSPLPVVMYVHGGAFRALSKDTHWMMGLILARRGYLVFNVDYRLAPRHPFPAAIEDVCDAYRFVAAEATRWGGDLGRLFLAGESAGANLVTATCIAACYERPEPWARAVFDTGVQPAGVLPACGLFEVSDTARYWRRKHLPWWLVDQLADCSDSYLDRSDAMTSVALDMANPVRVFERKQPPARPIPPFYIPVGTKDPLLDDTRRMERALRDLGVYCEARYFPGEIHAFHAFVWRKAARECWREMLHFMAGAQTGDLT